MDNKMNNKFDVERDFVKIEQSVKVSDNSVMVKKVCNKFSIESILGLNANSQSNDEPNSNRMELIGFCQKGNICAAVKWINENLPPLPHPQSDSSNFKFISFPH
jgi:hypothetical protein